MVQDSKGRLIMLGDHTHNNILIFDKSGKLLDNWGTAWPGGHGLSISKEGILSFSSSKYDAAIAGDPDAGIKFFGNSATSPADNGLFTKLATFLTDAVGTNGILTQRNNSLNSAIARIETEKTRFSARIDRLEERLFKQFTALDTSLAGLQSTQNLLAQRLGALQQ